MENIIYPKNQIAGAGTSGKVIPGDLIVALFSMNNNFQSIFLRSVSFKIFFLSGLALLMSAALKTYAQQNINYVLFVNNIYHQAKHIICLRYNNPGNFVIGIVGDTPLCDEQEDFTSNKTVGTGKIVFKKMPSWSDTYDCNFLSIRVI